MSAIITPDTFAHDYLRLMFNNIGIPLIGDAIGILPSAVAGSLWFTLHSAAVAVGDDQTTHEATYTGWVRQAIARSGAGFTVTGRTAVTAAPVQPPDSAGNNQTLPWCSLGTSGAGAGKIIHAMPLLVPLVTVTGPLPAFPAGLISVGL